MDASSPLSERTAVISGPEHQSTLNIVLSWLLWPLLATACCVATASMLKHGINDSFIVAFVFLGLAATLEMLERMFPHETAWTRYDGQMAHDVIFTLIGSGLPGALSDALMLAIFVGVAQWIAHQVGGTLWLVHWPIPLQVVLVVVVGDFGSYWGHRLVHTVKWLWPYHAVHHSVPRLWWLNSGRVHPIDSAWMIMFSMPLLFLLGVPDDMIVWLSIFTTFVGMLSHSNVNMRCGPLDWIFNTPNVHRWHHSRVLAEGNNNYGENTMVWDVLFGTHYRQALRRPPANVATETPVPASVLGQFIEPLRMSWGIVSARKPSMTQTPDIS
jgi:sterol desaturase/sphingolipid hydroxylase (fatty acid hydroxylase superfamily)